LFLNSLAHVSVASKDFNFYRGSSYKRPTALVAVRVNATDSDIWTPLHYAVNDHAEMVKALLDKGADVQAKTIGERSVSQFFTTLRTM
jgi:ankyrin repeat protein